jgi:hypothetical protein
MGLTADIAAFVARLDAAIDSTMQGPVLDGAKKQISETAHSRVYSYSPEFYSRRMDAGGTSDPGNMAGDYGDKTLTIRDQVGWQQLYGGAYPGEELVEALAAGSARYHFQNAGPRPFMEEAEHAFKPEFERLLAAGLRAHGFTVH